ncbi:hypothetical protein NWF32_30265 [Pseudomonas qingdaonensis]|nr:hypothetical protein [Pseudomonas qingdaonensis]
MSPPSRVALACLPLLGPWALTSQADCTFAPTGGNDRYVCDSGIGASLVDPAGDNTLILPAGGSGTSPAA